MVNCCRTKHGLDIESWGFLINANPLKMESNIISIEEDCLSYFGKLLNTDNLTKIWLNSHFYRVNN
jgi:hypothetical protein